MSSQDARFLSPDAQKALRARVVAALRGGMKPAVAARTFGVLPSSIWNWRKRVGLGNSAWLRSKKRGRPRGTQLAPHQAATTVRLIRDRCPDQLMLPFALWRREAVQHLLARRLGVQVSARTAGRCLAGWGLTPQKPLWRAYERDPVAVHRWLEKNAARISGFFLPGYSPDLNPDEFLNQDVKSNVLGRRRPATQTDLIAGVRSYHRSTQRRPELVKRYFHAESVRYAAG
ncbi:MAG: winged helix-turn-helix domain-containing protein [Planctomycetes bacterium]|nr:winged helix-turn-helix domain-containing protein [Planctomycetota bacterium]